MPMQAITQWTVTDSPGTSIEWIAVEALRRRLRSVRRYFDRACREDQEQTEPIHQLRVSIRRALAGIVMFKDLLPRRRRKRLKRRLRAIRMAAGPARDLDVAIERLGKIDVPPDLAPARAAALERLAGLRSAAQQGLEEMARQEKAKPLKGQCRKLLRRLHWRGPTCRRGVPTYGEDGPRRLRPVVEEFLAAARTDGSELAQLHALRIAGKRLRYAVEILSGAMCEESAAAVLGLLNELQDCLGRVNDHAVADVNYTEWARGATGQAAELWDWLTRRNAEELDFVRQEFHDWWTGEHGRELRASLAALVHERPAVLSH